MISINPNINLTLFYIYTYHILKGAIVSDIHKIYQPYLDKFESQSQNLENTALSLCEKVERAVAREKLDHIPLISGQFRK